MSLPVKVEPTVQIGALRYPLSQVGHQPLAPIISDPKLAEMLEQAAKRAGNNCDLNFLYRSGHERLKELGLDSRNIARTQAIQKTLGIERQWLIVDGAWSRSDQATLKRQLLALGADLEQPARIKRGKPLRPEPKQEKLRPPSQEKTRRANQNGNRASCADAQRRDKWEHATNPLASLAKMQELINAGAVKTLRLAASKIGISSSMGYLFKNLYLHLDSSIVPRLDPAVDYEHWLSLNAAQVLAKLEPALQRSLIEQLDQSGKILSTSNLKEGLIELRLPGTGGSQALAEIIRQLRIGLFCLEKLDQAEIAKIAPATRRELGKSFREVLARLTRSGEKLETK